MGYELLTFVHKTFFKRKNIRNKFADKLTAKIKIVQVLAKTIVNANCNTKDENKSSL